VYTFLKYVFIHVVYMLIGWDYVSELQPPFPKWYISMKPRWNDIERGKPKNSEKNLTQCHFVQHKFHAFWTLTSKVRGLRLTTWAMARHSKYVIASPSTSLLLQV
jgi:hypothetical protein